MTREEFIKRCMLMGVGISLTPHLLVSCKKEDLIDVNFSGKVLVIGAGSAGLMAAYTLQRYNIDFTLLEASSTYGGRVKQRTNFASFPIDIGAEWIHTSPAVFGELIDDDAVSGNVDLIPYQLDEMHVWKDGEMSKRNWASSFYGEYKFKSSTWFQFFEQYIVPSIQDKMQLHSPVVSIDYNGDQVIVTDENNNTYEADKVIVTVPLTILKNNSITFSPELPQEKQNALARTTVPDGLKVFIKFSKKFYPDLVVVDGILGEGERLFYDAAFKKESSDNVLALFNVGPSAAEYTALESDEAIFEKVMGQLDEMFDGQASQYYLGHVVQNWSAEPYIQGSYSFAGDNYQDTITEISAPLADKVYFAGEALHRDSWSTVHGAGFTGIETAKTILQNG